MSSELHSQFVGVLILLSLQIVCLSLQVWRDAVWQNVAKLHSYISKHESELSAQHVFLFFMTNSVVCIISFFSGGYRSLRTPSLYILDHEFIKGAIHVSRYISSSNHKCDSV